MKGDKCYQCECKNKGIAKCEAKVCKESCPAGSNPVKMAGFCCPVCTGKKTNLDVQQGNTFSYLIMTGTRLAHLDDQRTHFRAGGCRFKIPRTEQHRRLKDNQKVLPL